MTESSSVGTQGPGRILGEATSVSAGTTQSSRSDSKLRARRRKPYQDTAVLDETSAHFLQPSGHESQRPEVQYPHDDVHMDTWAKDSSPALNDTDVIQRKLRMTLADGTVIDWEGLQDNFASEIVPDILRVSRGRGTPLDEPDVKHPKSFPEHYITLAPMPQIRHFNTKTFLLSKDHQNNKSISRLKVPLLYNGYDTVMNATARVALFSIADKCQFLDRCMVELFKALLPNQPKDLVEELLSRADAIIIGSDPSQSSTTDPSSPKMSSSRSTYLGELGHHLHSICQGESQDFTTHRHGEDRLSYLQDALELPYWDLIIGLFEAASTAKRAPGISQTIMDNAVAGCYQFIKSYYEHVENVYTDDEISEEKPARILEGIDLRLKVLAQYTQAVDPIHCMDAIFPKGSRQKPNETEIEHLFPENRDQVPTFSILFIVLALAMVPGMIGFAKAVQDGETGSKSHADFSIVIRDTIMTILGATLSAIQMFRSTRNNSAYKMAWIFSGLAVLLGVTAIIVYPLFNKAYSSLCGFFAQFFSIASLVILVLDAPGLAGKGAPRRMEKGDASTTSEEKKTR